MHSPPASPSPSSSMHSPPASPSPSSSMHSQPASDCSWPAPSPTSASVWPPSSPFTGVCVVSLSSFSTAAPKAMTCSGSSLNSPSLKRTGTVPSRSRTRGPMALVESAGMMNVPGSASVEMESLVPVPGPRIMPPLANPRACASSATTPAPVPLVTCDAVFPTSAATLGAIGSIDLAAGTTFIAANIGYA